MAKPRKWIATGWSVNKRGMWVWVVGCERRRRGAKGQRVQIKCTTLLPRENERYQWQMPATVVATNPQKERGEETRLTTTGPPETHRRGVAAHLDRNVAGNGLLGDVDKELAPLRDTNGGEVKEKNRACPVRFDAAAKREGGGMAVRDDTAGFRPPLQHKTPYAHTPGFGEAGGVRGAVGGATEVGQLERVVRDLKIGQVCSERDRK